MTAITPDTAAPSAQPAPPAAQAQPAQPAQPAGRRRSRPESPTIRPWAWWVLGLSVVAGAVGCWFGWPELAIPAGVGLAAWLIGAIAALGASRYAVSFDAPRSRVAVGTAAFVTLWVANASRRRILPGSLQLGMGEGTTTVRVPGLPVGATRSVDVPVPTSRRALVRVGPAMAVKGDPLGLIGRTRTWGQPIDVVVYPTTVPVPIALPGMAKDVEGMPTGQPSEADISFHALREYQDGDDQRSIHWRSTARLGKLMVRQSEDARRVQLALVVSNAREEYHRERDFELAVSAYASMGLAEVDSSGEVAVVAGGGALKVGRLGRGPILDHSAALQLNWIGDKGRTLAEAAGLARREVPGATLAILVTGGVSVLGDLRRIAEFLPREAHVLAVRCQTGQEPHVTRVGRLGIATIGQLDDLPAVLRKLGLT
ncbi:MAG: DUF58 domain-containing protein [Bifidobacteriaceae bacterium]|jgi:uncharacterized protein (DUF58 family)|nr:DUF58 domain-containing protein [Bifidobacteriaceae bacterium]